ncbi:MAG: FG-GAP repeat protein, partial [Verrucomicrobiota bacterium]
MFFPTSLRACLPVLLLLGLFLVAAEGEAPAPGSASEAVPVPHGTSQGLAKSDWASIREAHSAWEHRVSPVEGQSGEWQARNPGQHWTTRFDGRGFTTSPHGAQWRWGLELQSYGYGQCHTTVRGVPGVKAEGGRLTYQWDQRMEEWFVNDQRGLEHGFVLRERPAGARGGQALEVVMAVRGELQAGLSADGQTVHFRDDPGAPVLNYGGLKVWDADGNILSSRFQAAGKEHVRLVVEDAGARYPLTIDPIAQQAYLKASNTGGSNPGQPDNFGFSVAVSGDTVIVGAPGEDSKATGINGNPADDSGPDSGAAYLFTRSGTMWTQQAYLKAGNTAAGDQFGLSVAVSGNTVVVGANLADNSALDAGAAYVFTRNGTEWTQQAYLKAGNTGQDDLFGSSVAVSGDTVVIGAAGEDSNAIGVNGNQADNSATYSGAAYVFARNGAAWTQQAYLKAGNTGEDDLFGSSVAVSGDTVVIG